MCRINDDLESQMVSLKNQMLLMSSSQAMILSENKKLRDKNAALQKQVHTLEEFNDFQRNQFNDTLEALKKEMSNKNG